MSFIWLCKQTFDLPLLAWPVTLALFFFVGVGLFSTRNRRHLLGARNVMRLGALMIFPLAIVALGAIFQAPFQTGPRLQRPDSIHYPIDLLFWLHILYATALVKVLKGLRLFAISLSLLTFWLTCSADFIAQMSISGEWL
jgi:hypothetical protein